MVVIAAIRKTVVVIMRHSYFSPKPSSEQAVTTLVTRTNA